MPPRPPKHPTIRRSPPPPPPPSRRTGQHQPVTQLPGRAPTLDGEVTLRRSLPWLRRRAYLPVELWIAVVTLAVSLANWAAIVWLVLRLRAM